jgi:hypothetical protein
VKPNNSVPRTVTRPAGRPAAVIGWSGTRRRRLRARRVDLDAGRSRTVSVWACADASPRSPGSWLDTVVNKTVTHYSAPGDRVLLVTPPVGASATADRRTASAHRTWRRYDGLSEAAWSIARLGRSVQTTTADVAHEPASDDVPESQAAPSTENGFSLVIVAFDPDGPDRFDPARWARVLDSRGNIAVITHSHHLHGRWIDPGPTLLADSRRAGLACLDHVVLLQVPVRTVTAATSMPCQGADENPHAAVTVHADLFVFTPAGSDQ